MIALSRIVETGAGHHAYDFKPGFSGFARIANKAPALRDRRRRTPGAPTIR
jgi:hypothetical protein